MIESGFVCQSALITLYRVGVLSGWQIELAPLVVGIFLTTVGVCVAQDQSPQPYWHSELGAVTNGIHTEVCTRRILHKGSATVWIYIVSPATTNKAAGTNFQWYFGEDFLQLPTEALTNQSRGRPLKGFYRPPPGFYFEALNGCFGTFEMWNNKGQPVQKILPQNAQATNFPSLFRFSTVFESEFAPKPGISGGPPWPTPLLMTGRSQLANFDLDAWFALTNSGEYRLKVSPIIYRRSAQDLDLCERVDLPPVTIDIVWDK